MGMTLEMTLGMTCIDRSKGVPGMRKPPPRSKFFHFHGVFIKKNCKIIALWVLETPPPTSKILDPPLTFHHCVIPCLSLFLAILYRCLHISPFQPSACLSLCYCPSHSQFLSLYFIFYFCFSLWSTTHHSFCACYPTKKVKM